MATGDVSQRPQSTSMEDKDGKKLAMKRTPQDFVFLKLLGEGSYSWVFLAREDKTKNLFAVKVLNKNHIIREHKNHYVMREKEVLMMLNHPFFIRLAYTFQDSEKLYFVLSYAKGGELLDCLRKNGSFDLGAARFYAAEIVEALQHLRELNIIHRDLKPENILLNENLHIQISDFGSAKILKPEMTGDDRPTSESRELRRKNSFVGTAQYVSPEVLTNKKACFGSDLWALGCIIYQFMTGSPPFLGGNEYHVFQKIIKLEYDIPKGFNEAAKDLIQNLLVLDPTKRLGCEERGGIKALKEHPFFNGINFETLPNQTAPKLGSFTPQTTENEGLWDKDIRPGLDEKRIVEIFAEYTANLSREKELSENVEKWHLMTPLQLIARRSLVPSEERARRLKEQARQNEYHKFVEGNLIVKQGLLDKRKGIRSRRRMFLLTEGPHLYYVDPVNKVLKGYIPWSKDLRPEAKNFKNFNVHTPGRTYYLEDPESKSGEWVQTLQTIWDQYYKN